MFRGIGFSVISLAAAAALASCGSGGGATTTTAAAGALTKEQLAYRVNSDCRWANEQLGIVEKEADYSPTKASYVRERLTSGITRYTPPADERAEYDRFVAAWKQITALETEKATAIYKGDTAAYAQAKSELKTQYDQFTASSKALGFTACG